MLTESQVTRYFSNHVILSCQRPHLMESEDDDGYCRLGVRSLCPKLEAFIPTVLTTNFLNG